MSPIRSRQLRRAVGSLVEGDVLGVSIGGVSSACKSLDLFWRPGEIENAQACVTRSAHAHEGRALFASTRAIVKPAHRDKRFATLIFGRSGTWQSENTMTSIGGFPRAFCVRVESDSRGDVADGAGCWRLVARLRVER